MISYQAEPVNFIQPGPTGVMFHSHSVAMNGPDGEGLSSHYTEHYIIDLWLPSL